jgi:hypothetical protein
LGLLKKGSAPSSHTVEEPCFAGMRELLVVRLTKGRKDKENFIASLTKETDNVSSMLPLN